MYPVGEDEIITYYAKSNKELKDFLTFEDRIPPEDRQNPTRN